MGSDHYCLRWNNHQNNLLGVFSQLLQEESLVDVTLACSEGHSIRAHKVVLSACSSYFQSLFLDHPNRHPIIILKDVSFLELRTLIEFMYRGEVNVEYCRLSTLLKTAESLQVKGLAEMTHLRSNFTPPEIRDPGNHDEPPQQPSVISQPIPLMTRHRSRSPDMANNRIPDLRKPRLRLPIPVSPPLPHPDYPPDTSSVCDERSMSPEPDPDHDDDTSSIQSGPSDMTIGGSRIASPQCLKVIPGCANLGPVQQAPLSLKKESVDWDRCEPRERSRSNERRSPEYSSSGNSTRHLQDSDRERDMEQHGLYTCMYCRAAFPHQSKLTRHILSHSLDTLKYREQTTRHFQYPHTTSMVSMTTTMGMGFIETINPMETDFRRPLLDLSHEPQSTDPGEPPGAVCKFCGKAFPDVSSLMGHLPAHTGDRPFKCEFCGKAFKLRHHMKDHCRVHTGERPFRCSLCGKTFSRSTILKAHEKTHYPKYVRKFLSSPSPEEERRPSDIQIPCDLSHSENNNNTDGTAGVPYYISKATPSPSP